jgi:hypothetical protein
MFEFQSQEIAFLQFHLEPFCLKELDIIYFQEGFVNINSFWNSKMFFSFSKLFCLHDTLLILKCILFYTLYLMRANTNQFLPDVKNSSSKPFNSLKTLLIKKTCSTCPKKLSLYWPRSFSIVSNIRPRQYGYPNWSIKPPAAPAYSKYSLF